MHVHVIWHDMYSWLAMCVLCHTGQRGDSGVCLCLRPVTVTRNVILYHDNICLCQFYVSVVK